MKKLIPAIVMLLVSAILLGTSTYAWFSMNTTVYANGMKVQATTDGALYISNADSQPAYQNIILGSVSWNEDAAQIRPTSTGDLTSWYYASAAQADNYAKNTDSNFTLVSVDGNYFLKKTVFVRSEKNFDKLVVTGVTITPNVTGSSDNAHVLEHALTVAFKVDHYTPTVTNSSNVPVSDNAVYVANEATTSRNGAVKVSGGNVAVVQHSFVAQTAVGNVGASGTSQAIWTRTASDTFDVTNYVFQIDMYIYFDGQSSSCYSNALLNAVTLNATIDVSFSTENNPAQSGG